VLAFAAQLMLLVAALGEGRAGVGYGPHIDPGGTSTHYVHDEAVCAACQARSLHGTARIARPPVLVAPLRQAEPIATPASYDPADHNFENLSRAPPALS
jgi:hypothetical protein